MLLRLLLLSLLSAPVLAAELRVCSDNRNVPPLSYVGGMGAAQYILPHAVANLGMDLSITYHPQPRCLLEVEQGHFDAIMLASPNAITLKTLDFPMTASGQFDQSRAYLKLRVVAFRMKRNKAAWNGKSFSNLSKPVLYETGVPAVELVMRAIQVESKASARTPVHMIGMMRRDRADIGIGLEPAVTYALRTEDPNDEFEILQQPLFQSSIYLGIGKAFHAANPELSERLWDEIRRFIASPQWQSVEEQVLNNQLTPDVHPSVQSQPAANAK